MLPYVNETSKTTQFIQQFGGFNNNLRCDDSEFRDMENISLDNYPTVSTRTGKKLMHFCNKPFGMQVINNDHMIINYGERLELYNFKTDSYTTYNNVTFSQTEKSYATIGKDTLIMPDKKIFRYVDDYSLLNPCEIIDIEKTFSNISCTLTPCTLEGLTTGDLNYVKIETSNSQVKSFLNEYNEYDTITLLGGTLYTKDTDCVIFGFTTSSSVRNGIIISATLASAVTANVTFKRKCPDITHLVSLNNRIWGIDLDNHLIHACKLGNPFQWYNNAGISSDSYYVDIGYGDIVTGSAIYSNYVHFFTERKIIKIYGDYPSNYQVSTTIADGIKNGCHHSPAVVNGYLYYLGVNGIMVYDGSLPQNISSNFAPNYFFEKYGVAGKDQNKYVICIKHDAAWNERSVDGVFAYDTSSGEWTKFDNDNYLYTSEVSNSLCYVNEYGLQYTYMDRDEQFDTGWNKADYTYNSRTPASW